MLIGAVRGPVAEAEAILAELDRTNPSCVALDLAPEELFGLKEHFGTRAAEPLAPLLQSENALAMALSEYGEVRMPSPSFVVPVQWALEHHRELIPLEPDEAAYSKLFLKNMGYLDLVRRARGEHALSRDPPKVSDPDTLVKAWEERLHRGRGSQKMLQERRRLLVQRLRKLQRASPGSTLVAVVDSEHWEELSSEFANPS